MTMNQSEVSNKIQYLKEFNINLKEVKKEVAALKREKQGKETELLITNKTINN